jgi:hypothetical protein
MYLDGIGESQVSPRRGLSRGAWEKYIVNKGKDASLFYHFKIIFIIL